MNAFLPESMWNALYNPTGQFHTIGNGSENKLENTTQKPSYT